MVEGLDLGPRSADEENEKDPREERADGAGDDTERAARGNDNGDSGPRARLQLACDELHLESSFAQAKRLFGIHRSRHGPHPATERVRFISFPFSLAPMDFKMEEKWLRRVIDEAYEYEKLGLEKDFHIPVLHLYFNDDLTVA